VVGGTEVVDAIEKVRTGRKGFHDDVPLEDVVIRAPSRSADGHRPAPPPVLPAAAAAPTLAEPGWQAIDFISDLHLCEALPRTFEAWAAHLRHTPADAVFILGDLFELWVGDDSGSRPFEARCVDGAGRGRQPPPAGFMAGNRDFLVGPHAARLRPDGPARPHRAVASASACC
jgi:hypothetical protein